MSLNARTVGNGDILLCHAVSRTPSVSNAMALTRLKTIVNLGGGARQMRKLIFLTLKQKQVLCTHIHSSAPIVTEITKWTLTYVHSGSIGSIMNGISRNILRSVKTDQT